MIIKSCRNCKSKKLTKLFSMGKMSFTGKFSSNYKTNIPKANLTLVMCKKCFLVQLKEKFNPKYLYGKDYGYRSGINFTMTHHLEKISLKLSRLVNLKKGDYILDIASNDGTLLRSYKKKNIVKVGIDPIIKKFSNFYKNVDYQINNFFSYEAIVKKKIKKKFKIITACAVFYDLKDPNKFLRDISKLIDIKNGVFYLEFQDLLSLIKNRLFDTICHEHIEYYSLNVVKKMIENNNLKIIDVSNNDINGGSLSLIIAHKYAIFKEKSFLINKKLNYEKKFKLESKNTFKKFYKEILSIGKNLNSLINKIILKKKTIHGYGASTKGNVLLQFFKINYNSIKFIADRNKNKNGLYTPGSKIKIINESISRKLKPDYYLVLPWHFKKEILKREMLIRSKGTKFIFPLPKLNIV